MNSSDLTNYTVSFTDLSRIMKNLRNAFIYTASTQQRNGNFQQWLPYNALCLGKATPSHCILETMRPRAWARSSSHRLPGRSLPAALPLPAVPQPPGRAFHVWTQPRGIHPIPIQPSGRAGPCPGGQQAPPGCLPGGMRWSIPPARGGAGPHQPTGIISRLYLEALTWSWGYRNSLAPLARDKPQAEL